MHRRWCWFVASPAAALLLCSPTPGATVLERVVRHTVEDDGVVREMETEKVRLDSDRDVQEYAEYSVLLDENIELEHFGAQAVKPDGETITVDKQHQDVRQYFAYGELHSARRYQVAMLPTLPAGTVLKLGNEVEHRPYFPANSIVLRGRDTVQDLQVEVHGGDAFRWVITGPRDGLTVEELPDGLRITGTALPGIRPPDYALSNDSHTELQYAWGPRASWGGVGEWAAELVREVPLGEDAVTRQATTLLQGADGPWDRLARLLAFSRKKVRYVAVEVGIGGYRPSTPRQTLERQWGDCKDKAFLLLDLLAAADIEAYPALVYASSTGRIDPEFPTPFAFNHEIVAVPVQPWMPQQELPVSDGYLFVDATQTEGGPGWLGTSVQGQYALVLRGADSKLVRTPVVPGQERQLLTVEMRLGPERTMTGTATIGASGGLAAAWNTEFTGTAPELIDGLVRDVFNELVPGGSLKDVAWSGDVASDVPVMHLTATVSGDGRIEGSPAHYSLVMPGLSKTPEPRALADRTLPVRLRPVMARSVWTLVVPDGWCVPQERTDEVDNAVGAFRQHVGGEPGQIRVEREVELRRRWVEPEEIESLRALSIAEHRAVKRRIRADCSGAGD